MNDSDLKLLAESAWEIQTKGRPSKLDKWSFMLGWMSAYKMKK